MNKEITTSLAPWFTISSAQQAVEFYIAAFGAVETYRFEDPGGGMVVRLSVQGAEFWVSGEAVAKEPVNAPSGASNIRMILTVNNPDDFFEQAIKAGATEIFPVGEEHGWRLGRVSDPFGLHWEIGYQMQD